MIWPLEPPSTIIGWHRQGFGSRLCLLKTSYLLAPLSLTTEAGRLGSR